jgi:hypothetical protein
LMVPEVAAKRLSLLKEAVSGISRVLLPRGTHRAGTG